MGWRREGDQTPRRDFHRRSLLGQSGSRRLGRDPSLWRGGKGTFNYLRDGITKWIHGWKRNGWKSAAKKPVKNQDLWQRLDAAVGEHEITWHWVKGHAGHPENERADQLATEAISAYR